MTLTLRSDSMPGETGATGRRMAGTFGTVPPVAFVLPSVAIWRQSGAEDGGELPTRTRRSMLADLPGAEATSIEACCPTLHCSTDGEELRAGRSCGVGAQRRVGATVRRRQNCNEGGDSGVEVFKGVAGTASRVSSSGVTASSLASVAWILCCDVTELDGVSCTDSVPGEAKMALLCRLSVFPAMAAFCADSPGIVLTRDGEETAAARGEPFPLAKREQGETSAS